MLDVSAARDDDKLSHPSIPIMTRHFQPSSRGSLVQIEDTPAKISTIKPESPRPAELLRGIRVEAGGKLSALDISVWEMILSWTYEIDPAMEGRSYKIPAAALRRFLGEYVKRQEVVASFNRIKRIELSFGDEKSRMYSGVQMIVPWSETDAKTGEEFLAYSFAEPFRILMRSMREYAHIELGPMCAMGKYDIAIYKFLALQASKQKWMPGDQNDLTVSVRPDDLADILDYPRDASGKYNIGKLSAAVTAHTDEYKLVRRFKVISARPIYDAVKGRAISAYEFILEIQAPTQHHVLARYTPGQFRRGGRDDPKYQIRSDLWMRAYNFLGKRDAFKGYHNQGFFDLWTIILSEALNSKALTPGYYDRSYRGESLLQTIESEGAEAAAWGALIEELENPDVIEFLRSGVSSIEAGHIKRLADFDRFDRIGWKTDKKRAAADRFRKRYTTPVMEDDFDIDTGESVVHRPAEADDFSYAGYFDDPKETPAVGFYDAKEIQLTFNRMSVDLLEEEVLPLIKSGPAGGQKVVISSAYEDDETGEPGIFKQTIDVSFEEWAAILNNLQPYMCAMETYVIG
jgi:hypothetical protein